jgi:hypothetical protein
MASNSDYSGILSPRALSLVNAGVIVIDIHLTRDGPDVWSRVTQPHPRLGVRTNQSFPVEDLLNMLEKVSLPGRKKERQNYPLTSEVLRHSNTAMPFKEALALAKSKNLSSFKQPNGVENLLSPESLTFLDLERTRREFEARVVLVTHKIGQAKLLSRIATSDVLNISGCDTMEEWWSRATAAQKWGLLTTSKKDLHGKKRDGSDAKIELLLTGLQCSFRNPESGAGESHFSGSTEESEGNLAIF